MTHTEKKQMYNDIMKSVARTVNRRLNEAGVVNFEPDGKQISFTQLYSFMIKWNLELTSPQRPKGLLIKVPNSDIGLAVRCVIEKSLPGKIARINCALIQDSDDFTMKCEKYIPQYNQSTAILFDETEFANRSLWQVILGLTDGKYRGKTIFPSVIVIGSDFSDISENTPIMDRFISYEIKC